MGRRGRPRALSVLGLMRVPGGWIRRGYLAVVLLLDVSEEGGIGEVPLAAGTAEFALGLLLDLHEVVATALLLAHKFINEGRFNQAGACIGPGEGNCRIAQHGMS